MALKIRLRQQGKTNRLAYRLVLADEKSPRDGKYLEMLGWYQPCEKDTLSVNGERIAYWLEKGAQLSEKAKFLVKAGAPEVMKDYQQKQLAKRNKKRLKRKATKK